MIAWGHSDYETGWDAVVPNAQPYYDRTDLELAVKIAKVRCAEWSYEDDAHGYCHERSVLVVLVKEVMRAHEAAE